MNKTVLTVVKAIAGVLVLLVLFWMVNGWLTEYRTQASKRPASSAVSPAGGEGSADSVPATQAGPGDTVVVLVDDLNMREEPASDAKSIVALKKDDTLVVVKQEGKWYQVKTAKGTTGWVSASPSYTRIESK